MNLSWEKEVKVLVSIVLIICSLSRQRRIKDKSAINCKKDIKTF